MNSYTFKTKLKCGGCVSSLLLIMNEVKGIKNWNIGMEDENRKLTVYTNSLIENDIIKMVSKIGYIAEPI